MNFASLLLLLLALPLQAAGSKACAGCHADIYRSYMATPMARSSGAVISSTFETFDQTEFASPEGSARYKVSRRPAGIVFDFAQGGVEGQRQLDYYLGSGEIGRSYIGAIEEFLFQAPVSYYAKAKRWSLSPGYERGEDVNLMREVEPGCLNCHATGIQARAGTSNGYRQPPFLEAGVACERCHGSGEEHIKTGKRADIVNPAKLAPAARDSVCAQCHLPGAVEIARAGNPPAYRPGALLNSSVVVFVWQGATRETTVNGHFEQLARSACRRGAEDKLWCGTCHNPHTPVKEAEKAAYYRGRCQTCHAAGACKAAAETRARAQDNCIACHMASTPAVTVQHAALSDHTIARVSHAGSLEEIPDGATLAPFPGFQATDRDLGLAYATLAIRDNNRSLGVRAFELLNKSDTTDAKVASRLAQLYDRMGKEQQACDLYARIVAADATQNAAAVNLGTCLAGQGKMEESLKLWRGALQRSPGLESARLNLAVALFRTGDRTAAQAALREGLKFNPVSRKIRELLNAMDAQ